MKKRGGNRKPQTFRLCAYCGAKFGPLAHLSQRFCGPGCAVKAKTGTTTSKRGRRYPHLQKAPEKRCPGCGEKFRAVKDTARRKQLYCSLPCYLKHRRVSFLEKEVFDRLASLGVPIERTAKRGRWTFDGAIRGTSILIEVDGDFWHSLPKAQARDARKSAWCLEKGLDLMRIRECDYRSDPERACDIILARWEAETGKEAVKL